MKPYYRPYSGRWKKIHIPLTKDNIKADPSTIVSTPEGPGIKQYMVGISPTTLAVLVPCDKKATAVVTKEVSLDKEH